MSVLAHAGGTGWDEILLTIAPLLASVAVFGGLRQRQRTAERSEH
jgi:hypothetical protein